MENNCMELTLKETCAFLKERDNFTLLCHGQPDGDTIGSGYALAYALKQLGKKARVLCCDPIPLKFHFISNALEQDDISEAEETVIAVDVADNKLLGSLNEKYGSRVELCIDHHISNVHYSKLLLLDSDAGANCEIIFEILKVLGAKFDRHILDAIYTGITTDTGCFKYSNTTSRTHTISAELIDLGVDYAEINRIMFDTKSRSRIKLEGMVMDRMEFHFGGRVALIAITREMIEACKATDNELDGINAMSRTIEGVMAGVTMREKEDGRFKISLRTNAPVDAMKICKTFGGGGHPRAAGCEFKCSPDKIKEQLLPVIKETLEEQGCLI